jgi:hypothetical protein
MGGRSIEDQKDKGRMGFLTNLDSSKRKKELNNDK